MPRVALIHDFLLDLRGAERVFAAICDAVAWPSRVPVVSVKAVVATRPSIGGRPAQPVISAASAVAATHASFR
jgi:hypothetical protein